MADEKHVTLRYFASVREALGCDTERWQTRAATAAAALHAELLNRGAPWADALSVKGSAHGAQPRHGGGRGGTPARVTRWRFSTRDGG